MYGYRMDQYLHNEVVMASLFHNLANHGDKERYTHTHMGKLRVFMSSRVSISEHVLD